MICQRTMSATARMMFETPKYKPLDGKEGIICRNIRSTIKETLPRMEKEWKHALKQNWSETTTREMVNLQCIDMATKALERTLDRKFIIELHKPPEGPQGILINKFTTVPNDDFGIWKDKE